MRLFNTISIEIASLCNRKCKFCPVAYNTRPKERMAEETVTEAIRQLGEIKYNGRIEWYIYNEPCMEMEWLKYVAGLASELVPRATQMIATNGDYFRNGGDDLLRQDRSLPLCKSCDFHAGAYPNNVDKPNLNFADDASIHSLYEQRLELRKKH
jgi:MoaA/NifB/PqqE/SkfB family radical SAM enzyme